MLFFFFCNKTEHFKAGINKTDLFTCNLWKCSAKFAVKLHFPNLHACWSFGERCKIRRRSLFLRVMNEYIHEKQIKPHDCESEMFILFHFAFAKGATINPVARVNAYIWNSKSFRSHTDSHLRTSWLYDVRSEMHRNMKKKKLWPALDRKIKLTDRLDVGWFRVLSGSYLHFLFPPFGLTLPGNFYCLGSSWTRREWKKLFIDGFSIRKYGCGRFVLKIYRRYPWGVEG